MKGLIIKDLMCLRKQRVTFCFTVVAVIVLSVMFVLSAKYGNIALANQEMMVENGMSEVDVKNLSTNALILFMILPIAMVGDVSAIIVADGKAGFAKVSSALPVSIPKRVLAKYITIISMFGIGVIIDIIISFVLSLLTDIISFREFFGIIIAVASIMFIYGALTIVFSYLFGYGKESYGQMVSIISIALGVILIKYKTIKEIFTLSVANSGTGDINFMNDFMNFLKYKSYILLAIAVVVAIVSYIATVNIAKRKRGII